MANDGEKFELNIKQSFYVYTKINIEINKYS